MVASILVGDVVLPTDVKDFLEFCFLELLQMFDVLMIQGPCLTNMQKGGESHRLENHDFDSYGKVMNT